MRRPFAAVAVFSTAAAVFSLAGCGSSTGTNVTSFKSLPAAEQASFEASAAAEVEASAGSFVSFNPYGSAFGFFNHVAPRARGIELMVHGQAHSPRFQTSNCTSTETPTNPVDSDNDGVPDTVTINSACAITDTSGSFADTGAVAIGDQTPQSADLDYNASANVVLDINSTSSGSISLNLVGTNQLAEGASSLTNQGAYTLKATIAGNPQGDNGSVKIVANENASYTPTGGALPTNFDLQFPAGNFTLTGNWQYDVNTSKATGNLAFSVATQGSGLAIDPVNCQNNAGHIVSGTVVFSFSDGTKVTATWGSCPIQASTTIS